MLKLITKIHNVFFTVVIEPIMDKVIKKLRVERYKDELFQKWIRYDKEKSLAQIYAEGQVLASEYDKLYAEFERSLQSPTKD